MFKPRWPLLLLLGLLGYAALYVLYPRLSPAARWGYTIDRAQTISLTRAEAARYGYDLSGWRVLVTPDYDRQFDYYSTRQPNAVAVSLLSPITTNVIYDSPDFKQQLTTKLNARGQLIKFEYRDNRSVAQPSAQADAKPAQAPASPELQQAKATAEAAFKQLAGETYQHFKPAAEFSSNERETKFNWVAAVPDDQRLTLTAEVVAKAERITALNLTSNYSPAFQAEFAKHQYLGFRLLSLAANLLGSPVILLGLIFYFIAVARKEIQHRQVLRYLGLVLFFVVLAEGLGSAPDTATNNFKASGPAPAWLYLLLRWLSFAAFVLFPSLTVYALYASGQTLAAKLKNRRTIGIELLLQGKLRHQYVAGNLAAGILLGGLVAVLPLLVQASGLFSEAQVNIGRYALLLTARAPAAATPSSVHVFSPLLFFSFVVPFLEFYLRRAWLTRVLILVLGFLWLFADNHFDLSEAANGVHAALLIALYYWIYQRFDLLGLLSSCIASQMALGAATLLVQPSPSLRASAVITLCVLGGLLLVAFVLYRTGAEVEASLFEPLVKAESRAERERLKAEFEVASRAQRQMLPDAPPELPGFEIAATCQPSKDVGGDLYDFLPLPNGKLGIVVADVSGKGVPAALYMTLTKGVLEAVAQEQNDPGAILREVNRHLYEACRRKVFVTLFLAVLDPATRTLSYARAGHNPTIWRSPRTGSTTLLRPAGMGLGLNRGKTFDATLKVESLQLESQDALIFYSDGITEAMNNQREEYGEERLLAVAEKADGLGAGAARDLILADVKAFLGTVPPQDDQTLVVLKAI